MWSIGIAHLQASPSLLEQGRSRATTFFGLKEPSHPWQRASAHPLPLPPSVGLPPSTLCVEELKQSDGCHRWALRSEVSSLLPCLGHGMLCLTVFPYPGAMGWLREVSPGAFPAREALGPPNVLRICLGAARSSRSMGNWPQECCQQQWLVPLEPGSGDMCQRPHGHITSFPESLSENVCVRLCVWHRDCHQCSPEAGRGFPAQGLALHQPCHSAWAWWVGAGEAQVSGF